jgi:hypothetical protein
MKDNVGNVYWIIFACDFLKNIRLSIFILRWYIVKYKGKWNNIPTVNYMMSLYYIWKTNTLISCAMQMSYTIIIFGI